MHDQNQNHLSRTEQVVALLEKTDSILTAMVCDYEGQRSREAFDQEKRANLVYLIHDIFGVARDTAKKIDQMRSQYQRLLDRDEAIRDTNLRDRYEVLYEFDVKWAELYSMSRFQLEDLIEALRLLDEGERKLVHKPLGGALQRAIPQPQIPTL